MSKIKGTNTKPEVLVRKFLFSQGFRYRKHVKHLPGSPDIVLSKYKTVIFVNGCFWHGHLGCSTWRIPLSRKEYWQAKIERNRARDITTADKYLKIGWRILIVWECELRNKELLELRLQALSKEIQDVRFLLGLKTV